MNSEQQFMMLFRYSPNPNYRPTSEEIAAMHQAWGSFIGNLAIKEKLVSTNQLGFAGKQITADLSVIEGVLVSDSRTMSGNMIVRANSLNEAVEMAKDSPILTMGGTVEVRDIIPMND